MRWRWLGVVLVVLVILMPVAMAATTVTESDGFEDGDADEWTIADLGGPGTATIDVSTDQPESGTYHANVSSPDDKYDHPVTEQFDPGGKYWNFTGYLNVTDGSRAAIVFFDDGYENATAFEIRRQAGGPNELHVRDRDPFDASLDWQTFDGPRNINSEPFATGYYRLDVDRDGNTFYFQVTGATGSSSQASTSTGTGTFDFEYDYVGFYTADGDHALFDNLTMSNTYHDPVLDGSSAAPVRSNADDVTFEIAVEDRDFPSNEYINGTLYLNGSAVGTDSRTSNGTLSVTASNPGTNVNVTWVAEDRHGLTDQHEYTFNGPGYLRIYNESQPDWLVANHTINATFYEADGDRVTSRQTSSGVIGLAGLDPGAAYVVQLDAPTYYTRTYYVDDITKNHTAYLLNQSVSVDVITLSLDDSTGRFEPPQNTTLYVSRALNRSGTTSYESIAADRFDAVGQVTFRLATNERYRLRAVQDGNSRVLGPYETNGDQTAILNIGQLIFRPDANAVSYSARSFNTTEAYAGPGKQQTIHVQYQDTLNETDRLEIVIYERDNPSNEVLNQTFDAPTDYGTFALNETINGSAAELDYAVELHAARPESETGDRNATLLAVGGTQYALENPLDSDWTGVAVVLLLGFVATIVGGLGAIAALMTSGVAALLWWTGFYPVSAGVVVLALVVSALFGLGGETGAR